jgi:DNA mismatch repair protein, C-terminal domain
VTDFFKSLPVRKQAALKHTPKYLAKVKQLMQAYAFARPTTRFSLRILKAKNDKGNWTYAPKPGANTADAAFNIVGRNCASQCEWSVLKSNGFNVQAFLPKPDADSSKIANLGQFISIDSRPVSTTRGPLKEMITMFTRRLRKLNSGLDRTKDPFICMNIVCPSDSYDPNIEPAKDNVLFTNSELVLKAVEELLSAFYPDGSTIYHTEGHETLVSETNPKIFGIQNIVRRKSPITIFEDNDGDIAFVPEEGRAWRSNMYGIDEEDMELFDENRLRPSSHESEDTPQGLKSPAISNPWTIARMNALVKTTSSVKNSQPLTPLGSRRVPELNSSSPIAPKAQQRQLTLAPLTPQPSSPAKSIRSLVDEELERSIEHLPRPLRYERANRLSTQGILRVENTTPSGGRQLTNEPNIGFVPASRIHYGTPLDSIPESLTRPRRNPRRRRGNADKPYVSPIKNPQKPWINNLPSPEMSSQSPQRQCQASLNRITTPSFQSSNARVERDVVLDAANALIELVPGDRNRDIRDFVATRQSQPETQLGIVSDSRSVPTSLNPSIAYSHAPNEDPVGAAGPRDKLQQSIKVQPKGQRGMTMDSLYHNIPFKNYPFVEDHEIHDRDPRRSHRTTHHLHRIKSSQLPLERVPAKFHLQNISMLVFTSATSIMQSLQKLDTITNYIDWSLPSNVAHEAFSTPPTPGVVRSWSSRLHILLLKAYPEKDIVGDLSANIQESFMVRE